MCRIEASKSDKFSKGDLVVCQSGWQDYSSQKATQCPKIANDIDLKHYLGALGTNGLTAYFGLHRVAQPSSGETVLVSSGGWKCRTPCRPIRKNNRLLYCGNRRQ